MASTHSKIWLTVFCQKVQDLVYFLPHDFVKISPACCPNTNKTIYRDTLEFQSQCQEWKLKMPNRKIIFRQIFHYDSFMLPLQTLTLEALSLSIHYLLRI